MRHRGWATYSKVLGFLLLCRPTAIEAAPVVALSLNAQIPPVAIVNQPFFFEFSTSTFSSTAPPLSYTLEDAPPWLRLNNATRTLSGLPSQSDLGSSGLTLVAKDASGTASLPVALMVSANQGPELVTSESSQFKTSGIVNDGNTILYHPADSISVTFPSATFANTDANTIFYATCANNTPLPSWLLFDSQNLSFTGLAPSFTSALELPQSFSIRMAASDVAGYFTAQTTFSIILETHQLYFENLTYTIIASPGQSIAYTGLQNMLLLDGKPVSASDLKTVTAVTPTWLSFDSRTLVFSGTAPINVRTGAVAVFAEDIYGDTANATVNVTTGTEHNLIIQDIGPLRATIGQNFQNEIPRDTFASDVNTTIELGKADSWLQYDNSTLTLSGDVPSSISPQTINLTLTATQNQSTQTQVISLDVISNHSNDDGSPTIPPHSEPTLFSPEPSPEDNRLRIAEGVIIPIIILLAVLLLVYFVKRKRRKYNKKGISTRSQGPRLNFTPWFRRLVDVPQRHVIPQSTRYSFLQSASTPRFGIGSAPHLDVADLSSHKIPRRPRRPLRPPSDIGPSSRPGSFVSRLANSRWSFRNQAPDFVSEQYAECPESPSSHESAASPSSASSQQTTRRVMGLRRIQPIGANPIHPSDIDTPAPARTAQPMRQVRQSISPGRGRAEFPAQRSLRGLGHGRPFPGEDLHARDISANSYISGGTWTDMSGSSHGGMPSMSSTRSYMGHPQRAFLGMPQAVRMSRPTMRPIGPSGQLPHPEALHPETATVASRSRARPPSFQSFVSARDDVIRKLREKESTSFSGYRSTRKSSTARDASAGRDRSLGMDASTPSTIEEAIPAVPLRLRPALDLEDASRVSGFYSSRTKSSCEAQRKGSLIHNRFGGARSGGDGEAEGKARGSASGEFLENERGEGRMMSLDAPGVPRRSSDRVQGRDAYGSRGRSRSASPAQSYRGNIHSSEWVSDAALSDSGQDISVPVPAPLRIRHSWRISEGEPARSRSRPSDDDDDWVEMQDATPPGQEGNITTGNVARRPVSVDPAADGDGRGGLVPAQSLRANMDYAERGREERRDLSMRFL
jgi:Putative Ig domain